MNENLNELFNIEEPTPNSVGEILQASKNNLNQSENKISDFDVDYTEVRDNLKNLISKGSAAIDGILHVASEGDSPRAYEVVGQLIKSVADANKDLIELHKKIKEITDTSVTNNNQTQTKIDNAIFVGSTADLQKMLRGQLDQIKQLENGT
jgi:hypothetical protein